jgi:hypothetical protein
MRWTPVIICWIGGATIIGACGWAWHSIDKALRLGTPVKR